MALAKIFDTRGALVDLWMSHNYSSLMLTEQTDEERGMPAPPIVFVGKPPAVVLCPGCKDVYKDPVISPAEGVTYCRKCCPPLVGEDMDKYEDVSKKLFPTDDSAVAAVENLPILCKNSLVMIDNVEGTTKWCYDVGGCSDEVTLTTRKAHEDQCGELWIACTLPDDKNSANNCNRKVLRKYLEQHHKICPHRTVRCRYEGCMVETKAKDMLVHEAVCSYKHILCPNKCMWTGESGELKAHLEVCELVTVTCGREDTEEPGAICPFTCERRVLPQHQAECLFRFIQCEFCHRAVSFRQLATHSASCVDRREICQTCGVQVFTRHMQTHVDTICPKAVLKCEYEPYGCTERRMQDQMPAHLKEDGYQHLRLLQVTLEQLGDKAAGWDDEVRQGKEELVSNLQASLKDADRIVTSFQQQQQAFEEEALHLQKELDQIEVDFGEALDYLEMDLRLIKADQAERCLLVEEENRELRTLLEVLEDREMAEGKMSAMQLVREKGERDIGTLELDCEEQYHRWNMEMTALTDDLATLDPITETMVDVTRMKVDDEVAETTIEGSAIEKNISEQQQLIIKTVGKFRERQFALEQEGHNCNAMLNPHSAIGRWRAQNYKALFVDPQEEAKPAGAGTGSAGEATRRSGGTSLPPSTTRRGAFLDSSSVPDYPPPTQRSEAASILPKESKAQKKWARLSGKFSAISKFAKGL